MSDLIYRGIHTSLYGSLPLNAIKELERAIWLKVVGKAKTSIEIFENTLQPYMAVPVVAIEHADLELEGGRWGKAWGILDSRLVAAKAGGEDLDDPEYRLMALTRGMLGTRHRGDNGSSVTEIQRTQRWLQKLPVTDYTDIQASCIRRYAVAKLLTILEPTPDNAGVEYIPASDGYGEAFETRQPWDGLHQLRRSLCDRRMFKEANALFRAEMSHTPPENREDMVQEFLSVIENLAPSQMRDYMEANIRLMLSTAYITLQEVPRAEEEMIRSEAAFIRFCDFFNVSAPDRTPHLQALEYQRLSLNQDAKKKLRRLEELVDQPELLGSTLKGRCLYDAAELNLLLYKHSSEPEYLEKYFELHSLLEKYDEDESGDLVDLVTHRHTLISFTLSNLVDLQKSLEWINGFLTKCKHFSSQNELESLYTQKQLILRALRRMDEAREAEKKAEALESSWTWPGKWIHLPNMPKLAAADGETDSLEYESDDEADKAFFWHWLHAVGDQTKMKEAVVDFVWKWSLEDIAAGRLDIQDFRRMFDVPESQITLVHNAEGAVDMERSRTTTVPDVASIVFTQTPNPDPSQEERYDRICKWLSEAPKNYRKRRLFCLLRLRDTRQWYFHDEKMWDLRIRELHHLLELEKTLPRAIHENFPHDKGNWHAALALSYKAVAEESDDFASEKQTEHLLAAEKYNELALIEFGRTKSQAQLAIHQQIGAEICMSRILGLQQLERQGNKDVATIAEIERLRNIGIKKVKKADEISTASEIHAPLSRGLDGFTHRKDFATFHGSSRNVHLAIELLLTQPEAPDVKSSVWSWVQRYKARALARTIGVRGSYLPDLESKIAACSEAGPLYEKMKGLQKNIDQSEPMKRFDLHRQMDSHLKAMKATGNVLLSQMMDLREATPFEMSDIEAIQKQAGTSIVLVHWFILIPYMPSAAKKLLLFTAKAQGEPTMDLLTTKFEDVESWQNNYLFSSRLDTIKARIELNRMLGGLVAPLGFHTEQDDVLVLCPSDLLHRLPLHAIDVPASKDLDREPWKRLIHRHPVVYTHSHSLLRSCLAATEFARHFPGKINVSFVSGIHAKQEDFVNKATGVRSHYRKGRKSIKDLAARFDTEAMMDDLASKEKFLVRADKGKKAKKAEEAEKSRLLHIQTHCRWSSGDPLDHSIEFPRTAAGRDDSDDQLVEVLTARELFDVSLPSGTHVNLIACQGGMTDLNLGDDVMGLVPALLYSGASSTVSTLWSIRDPDGVNFAHQFFNEFSKQYAEQKSLHVHGDDTEPVGGDVVSESGDGRSIGIVNLAKAMQMAVKQMDDTNANLYRWAAFVLHGFWQFPFSLTDSFKDTNGES